MTDMTRRTALRAAAWTAPAVSIAVAAPAFATSPINPVCDPTGVRYNRHNKAYAYAVVPGCTDTPTSVTIDGVPAHLTAGGEWVAEGFTDARKTRTVTVKTAHGEWTGAVGFTTKEG